ncbi:hypothetical protein [Streptomyces longispororuber]|uniref:hypothetical protein n=1 Tax=Streptomyces longispororuber TaxID=68230 RepID=UPI0027E56EAC|nr:hypothetical protein [Streptomyces longispororuber]
MLLIVHNVTSATRLLDVLPLFRDDLRVQLLATCTGSSPYRAGVAELLRDVGVPVLPWDQALRTPVDLAVAASFGGQLPRYAGRLAVLSHGVGYNKRLTRPGQARSGPVRPGQALGAPEPVFGLSPQWLLADGAPFVDALVLSHPEQVERLRAVCPEAVPSAVLAGDPCYDRLLAARHHRERYRRALGVRRGQRLVLLNSTWNPESLFGDGGDGDRPDRDGDVLPALLPRLTAELPADEYRVAAVLHPNIWYGHGPGQVRMWLDRARRGGLTLVDPLAGWRQALVAADVTLGDFGSVSYYSAALGTPVLLGAAGERVLGADSPLAAFVRAAPRLNPYRPLRPQLDAAVARHVPVPGPAELTSSAPGRSAELLRRAFYGLMGIPEPTAPALLEPLPLPPYEPPARTAPVRVLTRLRGAAEVAVARYADPRDEPDAEGAAHTAVHEDTLDPALLTVADVIVREGAADDPRLGPPAAWAAEVLGRYPHCGLAAYVTGPGECTVRTRDGQVLVLAGGARDVDPAACASALFAWLASGKGADELAGGLTVWTGGTAHAVSVTPVGPGGPGPR